jgi:hypothetical protein
MGSKQTSCTIAGMFDSRLVLGLKFNVGLDEFKG